MPSPQAQLDTRAETRRRVQWVVWLMAAGLLIGGGLRYVVRAERNLAPALSGDRAATDRFLGALGMEEPAATLEAALDGLPLDDAVYFVAPLDNPFVWGAYYAMSPLVWPRPFGLVACTAGGDASQVVIPLPAQPPGSTVSVVLWSSLPLLPDAPVAVTSPVGAVAQPVGPQLQLFTGQEVDAWTSFCSP